MSTVALALVLLFGVYIFRNYWWRIIQAKRYGIETDARVCRIESDKRYADGAQYPRRFYYVSFQTENGLQNEARLLNPEGSLSAGSKVRIRYLADSAQYAVLTKSAE